MHEYKTLHTISKFKRQRLSLSSCGVATLFARFGCHPSFDQQLFYNENRERDRERRQKQNAKAQRQSVGAQNIGVAFVVLICVCVPNVFGLYVLCVLAPQQKKLNNCVFQNEI